MGSTLVMRLVLERLDVNNRALNGRLACKEASEFLRLPRHWTVQFSKPLPTSAGGAAWQPHLLLAFRGLTFAAKWQVLQIAVASGSEANLELAWGLLRPCLFPEVTVLPDYRRYQPRVLRAVTMTDTGSAAIAAGHIHLLPWLIQNCCTLDIENMLVAAAKHCTMEVMMQLWQSIGGGRCFGGDEYERRRKAEAAGQSHTDALAKLSWLLSRESTWATPQPQQQQEFMLKAAMGAASSGSMPVLQWLLDKDMDVCGSRRAVRVLANSLLEQHVDVADWLVEVASCPLPLPQLPRELEDAWFSAGRSGSMQPIRWLLGRGVPVHAAAVLGAARLGHLEAVQFLHAEHGLPLTTELFAHAVESGSMPTVQWLLQAGCPMGPKAYRCAAEAGDVAMVLWLAQEAGCPWNAGTVSSVVDHWPRGAEDSARLLPTVRALVEAGCPPHGVQGQGPVALDVALCHGHLPLARYLHEECGVGFGPETLAAAAGSGCEPVLEWLVGAGCGPGAGYPYSKAADHGDLATLRCLRRLGVPLGDAGWWKKVNMYKVPLAAVRWLVEHGAPWDEGGARAISARARLNPRLGNEESLAWLHARIAEDAWAVQQAAEGWGRE